MLIDLNLTLDLDSLNFFLKSQNITLINYVKFMCFFKNSIKINNIFMTAYENVLHEKQLNKILIVFFYSYK